MVNGHKLVIISPDEEALESASSFESDSLHELEYDPADLESTLAILQNEVQVGIVLAPENISPDELIESLSDELPWIQ